MADLIDTDQIASGDYFTHPTTAETIVINAGDISSTIATNTTFSGDLYQGDLRPPNNISGTNIQVKRD